MRERARRLREIRKLKGECPDCGKPGDEERFTCQVCAAKQNLRKRQRYAATGQRDAKTKRRDPAHYSKSSGVGGAERARGGRRESHVRALRPASAARGMQRPIGAGYILAVYPYPFGKRHVAWHVYHARNPNEWYAAGEADSFDDAIDAADRKFGVDPRALARDPSRRPRVIRPTPQQRAFIAKKIPILIHEGYPQRQAIAIAFRMAGAPPQQAGAKRRA